MKELPEVLLNDANSQNWWNAMLKRQIERKLHLRRMCETRYNQSVLPLTEFIKDNKRLHSFYYVDKFKLIYSFVHKVGSSNWARMLKTVTENNRLKRLYLLPTDEALWRLQNYTSFIIVRHPLVRLLSAYKDKFVEHHIPHFKSIGRQIMKRYRDGVTMEELQRADNLRFGEFLRYLVADKRNRGNTHWDNLIIRNRVCLFNYDIIAKLETGDDDTKFILKSFNLEGLVNLGSHYTNYTGKKDTLRSFYSKIPKSLLQSVIDAYESDFVLFNYSKDVP
ncbi:Carbohydrate sulfotransferase 14 [Holothuria leucospilota]|uniref:Carbohydrate sulfotransferase n=1 Tax=Holothuria leucospilota TaxID=206669 RepID=A0A9Q1BCG8_HOLLE|nr:Carbohydrate sulfotransferase 14 [Holothuria leucospilota]